VSRRPVRLTVAMTHPAQYGAPWFRHIAARCADIDLTVLYAIEPAPGQQAVGFGGAFRWDVPLTEGYRCRVIRPARHVDALSSDRFRGVDVPEIGRAIRDTDPDVVLVPGWHSITLLRAVGACRRRRIPVLYRGDSHLGSAPGGWRRPLWTGRTWLLLRLFSAYLSVGHRAGEYLRRFGIGPSRIFPSPHAVDNDFFARSAAPHRQPAARAAARASWGLDARDFVVLFVGKLEPAKRLADLIRAMARLAPGSSLLVVGGGERDASCRAEAARLGVRTGWAGFLNQSELGRAYAAADCLALPSERESWGLVVNEAMATGVPCVVSDRVGCAPDLVRPGETGESFAMGDVSDLAAALGRIRARADGGHDWAPACVERASAHSFARATAGLRAACLAVAASRDVSDSAVPGGIA
jgi:glycosyltransferase involved in cell wall biosynthesis